MAAELGLWLRGFMFKAGAGISSLREAKDIPGGGKGLAAEPDQEQRGSVCGHGCHGSM